MNKRESWLIAAARFCVENSENGFALSSLQNHFENSDYTVTRYQVQKFFEEEIQQPSGRRFNRENFARVDGDGEYVWFAPYDLVQKLDDHDELVFARETAENASKASRLSIAIAIVALLSSIAIPIFYTQTVRLEAPVSKNK